MCSLHYKKCLARLVNHVDLKFLRLTELQSEHAKNVQYLLKQVETVSTNSVLER
jgi:hypothetical protein